MENNFESFGEASLEDLVTHVLKALKASMQEGELTTRNCTITIVGKFVTYTII